eukprot:CAMPEP_0116115498 /NCGR_PEP_ID=MMETSP0329-20121206/537_1 /TAXON_ID=697910 /ORGANISM="Pseudo-nitzschia arenysensis, Strain B593" /LENGTH=379 /DNA_ID=CAMNT_0003608931 /DNA_START=76 /DNA_END=1215 /DNA_ORIENTATION=+
MANMGTRKTIRLLTVVATTFMLLTTSKAWVMDSRARYTAIHPSTLLSQSVSSSRRKRMAIHASKNSDESSSATLPRFPSMFNRNNNDEPEIIEEETAQFSFFGRETATADVDIEHFSVTADETEGNSQSLLLASGAALAVASALFLASPEGIDPSAIVTTFGTQIATAKEILADPGTALDNVVELTDSMGNLGMVYFGVAYCIAEILAVPAIPLTASAGYLFGPLKGTAVVLFSASIAAGVSFQIGRTLLRDFVEDKLKDFPKFAKIDKAIGREGFKLMLLLRLSPVFPFALSNYLYGASSINFPAFFGGTLLGFAPGTLAYVYTGYVGKALTGDAGGDVYPWYVYLGGLALFGGLLKVIADTATNVIEEIEAEEAQGN